MILQPAHIAIDYSYARPAPTSIVDAGVKLVVRYISPRRTHPKNITAVERDALHDAGLSILLVWENSAIDPLAGAPMGSAHGHLAGEFARSLDYPHDLPIIVAVDFDAQPPQMPIILSYLAAFKSACGYLIGVYGKADMVTAAAGISVLGWQTVAWSRGKRSPHADVLQHAKPVHPSVPLLGAVDDNTVLRPFPAWSALPDPEPPPPPPDPPPLEDDMIVTIFELVDSKAAFVGDTQINGLASTVRWSGPGDQKWADRRASLVSSGARVIQASIGNLINFALDGPLPTGDPDHIWDGSEFANTAELQSRDEPTAAVDAEARDGVAFCRAELATQAAEIDAAALRDERDRALFVALGAD